MRFIDLLAVFRLFDHLSDFKETDRSLVSLKVKAAIDYCFDQNFKEKNTTEAIFKTCHFMKKLTPISTFDIKPHSVHGMVSVFLFNCVNDACGKDLSTQHTLYNTLTSILFYLSSIIVEEELVDHGGHNQTKVLALKQLCSIIDRHHEKIHLDYPSILMIFSDKIMFNICQILVFFNSPLVDFQFYVHALLLRLYINYKHVLKLQISVM